MGAVPDAVLGVRAGAEVLRPDDLARQVWMFGIDAGVENSHGDAVALQPGRPGAIRAHLDQVAIERSRHLPTLGRRRHRGR